MPQYPTGNWLSQGLPRYPCPRSGNDWVILALGHRGRIEGVETDTAHFEGSNHRDRAALQAAPVPAGGANDLQALTKQSETWPFLLPEAKLKMDQRHFFTKELANAGVASHLWLSIYPDGGIGELVFRRGPGDETDLIMQRAVAPQEEEAATERCPPARATQPPGAGGEGL